MQREEPYLGRAFFPTIPEMGFPFGAGSQVVHGRRQLVLGDVGLSPATSATLVPCCHRFGRGLMGDCRGQLGGRWGRRQIIMPLMSWASRMLQWPVQRVAIL